MAELAIHGNMIELRGLMREYRGGKVISFPEDWIGLTGVLVRGSDSVAGDPEFQSQVVSESTGEYSVGDGFDMLAGESSLQLSLESKVS